MPSKFALFPRKFADALGVSHLIVANLVIVAGQIFPNAFYPISGDFPGLLFVYKFLDTPVFWLFEGLLMGDHSDSAITLLLGEIVILLSSFLYGLSAYLVLKAIIVLFVDE